MHDPHQRLGIHKVADGWEISLFRPGAKELWIQWRGKRVSLEPSDREGIFVFRTKEHPSFNDYKVFHSSGLLAEDPYAFPPSFGELDQYLFSHGVHYQLYEVMGGRITTHCGIKGARFTVWAPSAMAVSIVGDFNHWDGRVNPLRSLGYSGIWEIFIPGLTAGMRYKFEIHTQNGGRLIKSDPYALAFEVRPKTASVLYEDNFIFTDEEWMEKRKASTYNQPINIYEVHLGSWRKGLCYREAAHALGSYCLEMGYTHVQLLPILEHPLDESWGYQIIGYFAPTSRFGSPEDFKYFVNHLHSIGIGLFLDWVPGHFPSDGHALSRFDGTALYEHEDPRQGWHPHWDTYIFNFGRVEVRNFLMVSALFWLKEMHIDGLRVDAVASMLYLDYGRKHGEWIPNIYGGNENLEAIEFLKHLNSIVHEKVPGVVMIAEESSAFPGITHPLRYGGLGFDYKWNMGWMNDTLRYFSKDGIYRKYHQGDLTFSLIYAFSERFVLVLSHDEVVHGKNSLMGRFPGDYWQQFANARLFIGYMMTHPGKKLIFQGAEIGQWKEWNCKGEVEWFLTTFPSHDGLKTFVREINHLYLKEPALWQLDDSYQGFEWVDFSDHDNSVLAFLRKAENGRTVLVVHNFSPSYFPSYSLPLKNVASWRPLLISDDERFGGSGKGGKVVSSSPTHLAIELPPLATSIFEIS
jgi:1,4-alpha-glucan branching enzyme